MMTTNEEKLELKERLALIESMIADGRRTTESWGWTFLLWGAAYYVATAWAVLGRSYLAWPVTMIAAAILTGIFASRVRRNRPGTTIGRALGAVWSVMGTVLFVILMALSVSGHTEMHSSVAIACGMLATANGISSVILRWKMQMACALVWLAAGVGVCFMSGLPFAILSLAAIFFCQIVFGVYAMICEMRRRRERSAQHA